MRKERRNLNRNLSKALTLILSVFMLLSSYTPVVTADDYSIKEDKQVNKQAITLNSIFNSNPNKTITNNLADGSDVTVDSWADLKSVIEGWSDATKELTVRVDGAIAATQKDENAASTTGQIVISDGKKVRIVGIDENDEQSGIIYGLEGAKYDSMFKVENGTLIFGNGLTLSGKRVNNGECDDDLPTNSPVTYTPTTYKIDNSKSSVVYDPTNAITLDNSKFEYVKSVAFDMSNSSVSYIPAGTVTAKPGNADYTTEEIKGNHKLSEYAKSTATASLWLGINTEMTGNQLNTKLYGSADEAKNGEHYGQYMKVENGRIVYERPGVTKKTLEAVTNFTSFQFSDNPNDPVVVAADGTLTVPSYDTKFPFEANNHRTVVYIDGGQFLLQREGYGTPLQIVGSSPIAVAKEKGDNYWEIEGETFTKDQETQAQAKVDAINEREKRTVYKFNGEEFEDVNLAIAARDSYNSEHPAFWMINGDESNPYDSQEAALAAANPTFKVGDIVRSAVTPSGLFTRGNDNPIYMLHADETEISSLSPNSSYYLKSKDGYYLKANGDTASWTKDAPNDNNYSWVLRTENGTDNVLVNEATNKAIRFDGSSISISILGTDSELKVGSDSSKNTIYADLTNPSVAAFTTNGNTGAPIKLFTDAAATTEANAPLQENGVYYIGTVNNYFLRDTGSNVEWSTKADRGIFFQWTYKNGSFYSNGNRVVIYNDGNNNISFENANRVGRTSTLKIGNKGSENQVITANTSNSDGYFVVGDSGSKIVIYEIGTTTEASAPLDANKTYYLKADDKYLKVDGGTPAGEGWQTQGNTFTPGSSNDKYQWKYNSETGELYNSGSGKSIIYNGNSVTLIANTTNKTDYSIIDQGSALKLNNVEIKAKATGGNQPLSTTEGTYITAYQYVDSGRPTNEITNGFSDGGEYILTTINGNKTYYAKAIDNSPYFTWTQGEPNGEAFKFTYKNGLLVNYGTNDRVLYLDSETNEIKFEKIDLTEKNPNNGCTLGRLESSARWGAENYDDVPQYYHKASELNDNSVPRRTEFYKDNAHSLKNSGYFAVVGSPNAGTVARLNIEGAVLRDFNTVNYEVIKAHPDKYSEDDYPSRIAPILVEGEGAILNMTSGSIQNNIVSYTPDEDRSRSSVTGTSDNLENGNSGYTKPNNSIYTDSAGAIIFDHGSTGNIYGDNAYIKQNKGDVGALLITDNSNVTLGGYKNGNCPMVVGGGHIDQNVGFHYAGAVLVEDGAKFMMVGEGSTINSNVTWNRGGAVWATEWGTYNLPLMTWGPPTLHNFDYKSRNGGGTFILNDGEIKNNTAFTRAGAIEVESNNVILNGGLIAENFCRSLGGAIYIEGDVEGKTYTLRIDEGYIGQNYSVRYTTDMDQKVDDIGGIYDGKTLTELNQLLDRMLGNEATAADELGNPINSNSQKTQILGKTADRGDFGANYTGLGGGIWLCRLGGSATFDFDENTKVYIDNNYASGSSNRNNPGGTDFYLLGKNAAGAITVLNMGGQNWKDEVNKNYINKDYVGKGDRYLVNESDAATAVYGSNDSTPVYGDASKRISGYSLNENKGVKIVNNLSRDGGGIAADGLLVVGNTDNTPISEHNAKMSFSKTWAKEVGDPYTVDFKMYYVDDDENLHLIDDMSFTLDGNADNTDPNFNGTSGDQDNDPSFSGREEDIAVYEIAPTTENGLTVWNAVMTMPDTFDLNGTIYPTYKLKHSNYDGKLDPTKPEDIKKIAELAGSGTFTIDKEDFRLVLKEFKDGVEVENTVQFDDATFENVNVVKNKVSIYNETTCTLSEGYDVFITTANFNKKASNDIEPTIEKYINNVVHDTLYGMDDVIEYSVMAYVPVDADEIIIYDTLEKSLKFATDLSDWRKVSIHATNDHLGNGSVTVSTNGSNFDGYYSRINVAPTDLNNITLPENSDNTKDTFYVLINNETTGNNMDIVRGKWVEVTFKVRLKDEYKDITKLQEETWVSKGYDKKGSPINNDLLNDKSLKINELNNYLAESNDEILSMFKCDDNGLIAAKSKNGKYFQYNEQGDKIWYKTWVDGGTKIQSLDGSIDIADEGYDTVDTKEKELYSYNRVRQVFGDYSYDSIGVFKEVDEFNVLDNLIEYLETKNDGVSELVKLDNGGYAVKSGDGDYYQRTSMGDGKWYKTSLPEGSGNTLLEAIDGSKTISSGQASDEVDTTGKSLTGYNALTSKFEDVNNLIDVNEFRGYKNVGANWPVIDGAHTDNNEQHSGVPNDASYQVKHKNGSKSKHDSNTVTFDAVQPEKYVNSVVHSDIEYFDKVFDYEIMVYVPKDAERVTVYDTLGDSLMFVDNSGARQYVLNDAGDIKYNGDYSFEESHSSERNVVDGAPSSDDYTGVFNNWFWQGEGTDQTNKSMVYNGNIEVPYTLEDVKENAVVKKRTDRNVYVMLLDGKYYKSTNSATLLETWQADGTTETNTGWNNMWNSMTLQNNNIIKDIQGIDAVKETIVNNQLVVHDDNNHKGNNADDATVNLEGTPIDIKPGMVKIINGSSIANGVYPYNSIKEDYNGNTILLDIYDPDVIEQVQGRWLKLKYKAAIKPNYYKAVADKIASGNIDDDADIAWEKISDNGYIQDPKELTDGIHSGLANTANYIVVTESDSKPHYSKTNTVTVVPELMPFEITKKWEVKENYDMIPSEVEEFISKLHLYWDKEDVFDDVDSEVTKLFNDVTVTKSNTYQNGAYTWTIKWNNLPKLNSYYVTEARINGFNYPAYTSDNGAYENGTITNKQSSDLTLEIIANKEVIGKDITDKKYEFGLYYDKACTKPVRDNKGDPVTAKNNKETDTTGTIVFDPVSLPSIDNGQYKFYIKEIPGSDGSMTYDSSVKEIVATISNTTENLVKELNAAKVNIGNDVHYFKHYQDAKEVTVNRPVTRNGGWDAVSDRYAFIKDDSNVLVAGWNTGGYQTSGNYWYGYTYHYNYNDVTLQLVPGRYTIYTIDSSNTIHAREFEVVQKGSGIDIKKVVGAQDGYVWYEGTSSNPYNWKSLIEIENKYKYQGEKIVSVVGNNPTFTNTYNSTEIKVEKKWVGDDNDLNDRPESVSVELWANGSLYIPQEHEDTVNVARVELKYDEDETKSYKYSWKGLPVKDKNGNLIEYSVKEIVPKNYRLKSITPEKLTAESSIVTSDKELTGWKSIGYSSFSSGDKIVKIEVNNKVYYMENATTLASIDKTENATDYNNLIKNNPDALLWKVTHYYITDTKRVELVFQNVKYPNMYLHGGEKSGYTGKLSASTSPTYFYLIVSGSSVNAMFWWGGNHSYVYYANGTLESPKCQQYPVTFQEPQYEQTTQNINTFTITNEYYPEYNLPNSGGIGTYIFTIAGFMFLTLAFEKIFGFKKIK